MTHSSRGYTYCRYVLQKRYGLWADGQCVRIIRSFLVDCRFRQRETQNRKKEEEEKKKEQHSKVYCIRFLRDQRIEQETCQKYFFISCIIFLCFRTFELWQLFVLFVNIFFLLLYSLFIYYFLDLLHYFLVLSNSYCFKYWSKGANPIFQIRLLGKQRLVAIHVNSCRKLFLKNVMDYENNPVIISSWY